jgi:hypothetical protein
MTENTQALIIFVLFMAAFGWAGTDDYNYRCDQARKANKNETCKMVASKP